MAGNKETSLLDSWENFLLDTPVEKNATSAENPTKSTEINAKTKMKIEQTRIDRQFAEESFEFLLGPQSQSTNAANKTVEREGAGRQGKGQNTAPKNAPIAIIRDVNLKTFAEAESAAQILAKKIESPQMISAARYRFIDILFQACLRKMEIYELEAFAKKLEQYITDKKHEKNLREVYRKKSIKVWSQNDLKDEVAIVYGGGDDSEEKSEEDDYSDCISEDNNADKFDDGF